MEIAGEQIPTIGGYVTAMQVIMAQTANMVRKIKRLHRHGSKFGYFLAERDVLYDCVLQKTMYAQKNLYGREKVIGVENNFFIFGRVEEANKVKTVLLSK